MTIYVHFNVQSGRKAERLYNVTSIHNNGMDSVKVKMEFNSNSNRTYTDVSHVAVQPDRE